MADAVIIHTDEIVLKGGNRPYFERLLEHSIKERLAALGMSDCAVRQRKGLIVLRPAKPLDASSVDSVSSALKTVFGIAHFSMAHQCPSELSAIMETAARLMSGRTGTFRVTARRGDKSFPHESMEISRQVGGAVLAAAPGIKVDLHTPQTTVFVEVNIEGAFVSIDREFGPGGLPTDSTGRMVALLSGGIDSPVSAYKIMSRGCRVTFVHFHSYPHVGKESIEKVKRLAMALDRYQLRSELYLVPFAEIQRELTAKTSGALRVVLYRRAMMRIAAEVARRIGALGLVTGDSIGQVASQTPENLYTVGAAVSLPIYRPLVGDGKNAIIDQAKRIGTYEISIEPHDDCCTLFVPDHPELRSTPEQALKEEAKLDLDGLIIKAVQQVEIIQFKAGSWELEAGSACNLPLSRLQAPSS